ncbi:MAG: hypothetical protein NVSMB65_18700 [Chloroflexota bacterium]
MRARIAGQVPRLALDAITPAEIERIRAMTRVSVGAAYQLQMLARAVRPRLARVQAPLLIMHGRLDRVVAPRCAQEIYARAGSTEKELVWLERSGHMTPLDVDRQEAWERAARFIAAHTTAGELREPAQPWR